MVPIIVLVLVFASGSLTTVNSENLQLRQAAATIPNNTSTGLSNICIDIEGYRQTLSGIVGDPTLFNQDGVARMIIVVDYVYNGYNHYKWVVDFALGALTTGSVFLPGGPIIPIALKVGLGILMDPNMRRLVKEMLFDLWLNIPPSGNEIYNVLHQGTSIFVRRVGVEEEEQPLTNRTADSVDWPVLRAMQQRFAHFQKEASLRL